MRVMCDGGYGERGDQKDLFISCSSVIRGRGLYKKEPEGREEVQKRKKRGEGERISYFITRGSLRRRT